MSDKEAIETLKSELENLKHTYYRKKGKLEQLLERKSTLQEDLSKITGEIDMLDQVRILLQQATEYAREQARKQIESLVTNCLQYVFDMAMEFKIEINEVRSRYEAEFFVVTRNGEDEIKTKPQEARGGGVVDIISLALRIAMLQSSGLNAQGPMILDEPAKHVSEEYIVQVGEFLKQISRMFGRQVIMVTHDKHLSEISDRSYRVEMSHGVSIVMS